MRFICVAMLLASGFMTGSAAYAATISGPFQDLKEELPATGDGFVIIINTKYPSLFPPSIKKDQIVITLPSPGHPHNIAIKGLAYESYENPDFSGNVKITTIYGIDLDPTGTGLEMTGLDAQLASVLSFSDEQFFGDSGTVYNGVSLGTPTLAELPALLPGYDLSPFQGDPNSIVYMFETIAPSSDFSAIPETPSLMLGGLGLLGLAVTLHARKRKLTAQTN